MKLITDPNALAMPPHIEPEKVRGFALAGSKLVLGGGVGGWCHTSHSRRHSTAVAPK